MSLPTKSDLGLLTTLSTGQIFNNVEASTLNTQLLTFVYNGVPFVGQPTGTTPPVTYDATQFFMVF